MKILLAGGGTGGHLMPALALAEALRDAGRGVEPLLVGAERGIEAELLPRHSFRHRLLPIEPIYRRTWWRNARWLFLEPRVWREVGELLRAEQPALVIGTGGYVAGPVVWRAQRARIPTVLVEENAFPGLTTRWLARGARQVHLGFPEARARLVVGPRTEVFTLGNPVRLPTSAANHQTHNARALAAAGAAIHLAEHDLSAHALAGLITELLGEPAPLEALAARARARGHPNASREIVSRILTIVV